MIRADFHNQKGIVHFGIIAIAFLALAAVVGSSVVSNLSNNFNISEKAGKPETQDECNKAGCADDKQEWWWSTSEAECKKKPSKDCAGQGSKNEGETCPGVCEVGGCTDGRISTKGICYKRGSVCCSKSGGKTKPPPKKEEEEKEKTNPCKECSDNKCKRSGKPNCKASLNLCVDDDECKSGSGGGSKNPPEKEVTCNFSGAIVKAGRTMCLNNFVVGICSKKGTKSKLNCKDIKGQTCKFGESWCHTK